MIKAFIDTYEIPNKKKPDQPYRRLQVYVLDERTGSYEIMFNFALKETNLEMYDLLLQKGITKHIEDI